MKKLTDEECDVLVQQTGFQYRNSVYFPYPRSVTQYITISELHKIVKHAYTVGFENAKHKRDK
jgi:hypothetical protein